MKRLMVLVVAATLGVAGCGGSEDTSSSTSTSTTTAADAVPLSTTPRPDVAASTRIEGEVARIYPGVPEGKATDWAVSTCYDLLQGELDETELVNRTIYRYAGGDRPDPTPEQAAQILQVIRDAGFCER